MTTSTTTPSTTAAATRRENVIVIDNGAGMAKFGFAGDEHPKLAMHNCMAKPRKYRKAVVAVQVEGGTDQRSSSNVMSLTPEGILIGDQIDRARLDLSTLIFRRPLEKGYVVDCEALQMIWQYAFSKPNLGIIDEGRLLRADDPPKILNQQLGDKSLVLSTAPFVPNTLANDVDELVFDYFGFGSYCAVTSPFLSFLAFQHEASQMQTQAQNQSQQQTQSPISNVPLYKTGLILDSGFSFSHATPILNGQVYSPGIKRVNVGGKMLTNYLKEIVSFRAYNMMEETLLTNNIKEACCFVSLDLIHDLEVSQLDASRNTIRREYVLPDYATDFRGHLKQPEEPHNKDEQLLVMNNERMTVPELLFNPSDIGINQAGIAEAVVQAIDACAAPPPPTQQQQQRPAASASHSTATGDAASHSTHTARTADATTSLASPEIRELLYENIILVGGNTNIPNYRDRVVNEVRAMAPSDFRVNVYTPKEPELAVWQGGSLLGANDQLYSQISVTRQQYFEYGHAICRRRFRW